MLSTLSSKQTTKTRNVVVNISLLRMVALEFFVPLFIFLVQEALDMRLQQRQARETGICPVREELYGQCFGAFANPLCDSTLLSPHPVSTSLTPP